MSLVFIMQSILTFLPLQVENESLIENQEGGNESTSFIDDPGGYFMETLFRPIIENFADISETFMSLVFATPVIETEGPLSFGPPESVGISGMLDSNILPFLFEQVYNWVWIGEGGPITILAIVILVIGITLRGMFDIVDYKGRSRSSKKHSYITGLIWIVIWYPLFLGLVNVTHALILSFGSDAGVGFGLGGAIASTLGMAVAAGPLTLWILVIGFGPWLLLAVLMFARAIMIGVLAAFGPILIAGKHSNLPFISRVCDQILKKSLPVVFMALPIAPIMFIVGNFILSALGSGLAAVSGAIFMFILGSTLLFAVWSTFKIVSPQLASSAGVVGKVAAAGAAVATGGGSAMAYSAMKSGPAAVAARYMGGKFAGGGIGRWGDDDGSRD